MTENEPDYTGPDYKLASALMWFVQGIEFARRAGVDAETFGRACLLANAIAQAITVRGARVGHLVEAIDQVLPHGSILEDLPTRRARRPRPRAPSRRPWWTSFTKWPF